MATGVSNKSERPQCPRCGYDQSGLIESWKEACPLRATCAECGYGFDPADAIYPTRKRLPWFYEHAKHWWSVRAWLKTVLMLVWPPAFWKRVRPEHEVRVGRIWLFLLGPYLVLVPACALMGYVSEITQVRLWAPRGMHIPWSTAIARGTERFLASLGTLEPYSALAWATGAGGVFTAAAIFWLPVAGAFIAIPSEWSGSRLRRAHFVRLLGYAVAPYFLCSVALTVTNIILGIYGQAYYAFVPRMQQWLPTPSMQLIPEWAFLPIAVFLALAWPALYWYSAIRWGYSLPSTRRPFLIVLAVILTPWALFLAFMGYYEFIA